MIDMTPDATEMASALRKEFEGRAADNRQALLDAQADLAIMAQERDEWRRKHDHIAGLLDNG